MILNYWTGPLSLFFLSVPFCFSGTVHHEVAEDYTYQMLKGWSAAEQVINRALQAISRASKNNGLHFPFTEMCRYLNETVCYVPR